MKEAQQFAKELEEVLSLPRAEQFEELRRLRASLPEPGGEDWNTEFGSGSLYEAWSQFSTMLDLYQANTHWIRRRLKEAEEPWRIIEIGGGNGALWDHALQDDDEGELVLVDPVPETHDVVASRLPPGVSLTRSVGLLQEVTPLPDADLVVCSLTLHHVPGRDTVDLAAHGLTGTGKLEALQAMGDALRPRAGIGILNEADIYCDIELEPGSEVLANNLLDSYVRRNARALLREIEERDDAEDDLKQRWLTIVCRWCLDQMDMVDKPLAERDVYELDVVHWLELLDQAGLEVMAHEFTDRVLLFHQYVFGPR
jgi:SAM-dependent methyltransferase